MIHWEFGELHLQLSQILSPDHIDNIMVLFAAIAGIYFHGNLLFRGKIDRLRRVIKLLCVLALTSIALDEVLFVVGLLDSREVFALSGALLTASLMSLGMADWGNRAT